jgi:hypothetical protein
MYLYSLQIKGDSQKKKKLNGSSRALPALHLSDVESEGKDIAW